MPRSPAEEGQQLKDAPPIEGGDPTDLLHHPQHQLRSLRYRPPATNVTSDPDLT